MPQPLLKTFVSTAAGIALSLSSAAAQASPAQNRIDKNRPLLSQDDVTIYPTQGVLAENSTNVYAVFCPGSEKHTIVEKRNEAVVVLIKHSWEDLQKLFKSAAAARGSMDNDRRLILENAGIVTPQGDLLKAHTFNEARDQVSRALSDERNLGGISPHDTAFQKKMLNYARDFCFSRF